MIEVNGVPDSTLQGNSNRGTNNAASIAGAADFVGKVAVTKGKLPTGTYTATGAAIGISFGGIGAIVGGAIGAMVDIFFLFARPATEVIGWAKANTACGGIADKITADLKANLTAAQFTALQQGIEERAIQLIMALETNLAPRDFAARVNRYVDDIKSTQGKFLTEYDCVRTTIWRFLIQRAEYYAVADVATKLGDEMVYRLNVLVYDWLRQQGFISAAAAIKGAEAAVEVGAAGTTTTSLGARLGLTSDTTRFLTFFLIIGAFFGFIRYYKGK